MIRVLLVEDQESIALPLAFLLRKEGFEVTPIGDGAAALREFTTNPYDFVLLDLMLPSVNGIDICQHIRKHSDVPIIMLTAKNAEVDKIVGLESGADDYVTKPYSARELIARMRAVMRRRGVMPSGLAQLSQDPAASGDYNAEPSGSSSVSSAAAAGSTTAAFAAHTAGNTSNNYSGQTAGSASSNYSGQTAATTHDTFPASNAGATSDFPGQGSRNAAGDSTNSGDDSSWPLGQFGMDTSANDPFLAAEVDAFRQTIQDPRQRSHRGGHRAGQPSSTRPGYISGREGAFSQNNPWQDSSSQEHNRRGDHTSMADEFAFGDHAVLVGGRVTLDTAKHEVTVDGELVQMPLKEFELLELFLRNQEIVLTRQVLIERVWGANYVGDTKTLDVHVKRIRSKIEREPKRPQQLLTVRGLGYRFVPELD